jgi:hypothetical protein
MKTTRNLDDALLTQAKTAAAQQRTSLTRLIEEGLRLRLKATARARTPRALPVYHGKGGLAPGLSGLSNKALRDAADA